MDWDAGRERYPSGEDITEVERDELRDCLKGEDVDEPDIERGVL